MTLIRLLGCRNSIFLSHRSYKAPRVWRSAPAVYHFSTTRHLYKPGQNDKQAGRSIRILEQTSDGKLTDNTDSENEAVALKSRIEQLERELRQYESKQGITPANSNTIFRKIFERMPEGLRPKKVSREELKAMIKRGDPEAMDYAGAQKLAKQIANGNDEDYDIDSIMERLPKGMRSNMTRDQLRELIEKDDPSIQEYLMEEVAYDLDRTYDRIPALLKSAITKDQVREMIQNQDPAIEDYLYEVESSQHDLEGQNKALGIDVANKPRDLDGSIDREALHVGIPNHVTIHMNGFNRIMLDVASQSKDPKSIGLLWVKYELCKKYVPGFTEEIPPHVWKILWLSQWAGNLIHESKKRHLWTLVNDMVEAGHPLDPDQKLVQIEYEFSEGNKSVAMKMWRQEYSSLERGNPKRDDYRDVGVRLHVEAGLLGEAQDLIFGKQRRSQIRASDVAVLIATKAGEENETSLKMAWTFYLDLRQRLGDKIKFDDFDQIAMTFLGANKPNLALAVFKDMVLSARLHSRDPSVQARSLDLVRALQAQTTNKDDLDRISLEAMASIPRQLENKYFYASWIKRLIGLNEVDATVQVLELMYQRAIRPDARHVNGIIGAWLRGPDKDKHQLALQIAWSMVNERLKFVARRDNATSGNVNVVDALDKGKLVPPYISQNLPSANIETFCLLLLYYQRRSMMQSVDNVEKLLQEAEITPNSFFMNHLMFAELRKQNIAKAWKIYDSGKRLVMPDLETFSALWSCEKVFTTGRSSAAPEFPRSRRLFCIMSEWFHALRGRNLKQTLEAFSDEMYNEVVRCFCFQKDIEGTIVALYGLRDMFGAYPNPETERIILIQLARMGEGQVPRRRRSRADNRFSTNASSVQDFARITKVANLVKEDRIQLLEDDGVKDTDLKGKERKEEDLYRIVEVMRISLQHQAGIEIDQDLSLKERIANVAIEMSVSRIDIDNPRPPK